MGKIKSNTNDKNPSSGMVLPIFKMDESIITILSALNIDMTDFYHSHAFVFAICIIIAQIRSRAMTAGINDVQQILKLPSINYYIKILSRHAEPSMLGQIFAINKVLPFLKEEEADDLPEVFELISEQGGKANTKMAHNVILSSLENKIVYAKGNFRSFIGQLTTFPIYSPNSFGTASRYSDMTIGMLISRIRGSDLIDENRLKDLLVNAIGEDILFDDAISLNVKHGNLVNMESSLSLSIERTNSTNSSSPGKENEKEANISQLEKIRRQRRNSILRKTK